jgi:FMN reductase
VAVVSEEPIRALGIVGSPSAPSRTESLIKIVLAGAASARPVSTKIIVLGGRQLATPDGTRAEERTGDTRELLRAIDAADVVAIGTPIHRASYSASTKALLDLVPRGKHDGAASPLRAKPVVLVASAASPAHFLGLDPLTTILHGFFAAHVIPPGVFATHNDFDEDGHVSGTVAGQAEQAGRALVELHRALRDCPALRGVAPQL